MGFIFLIQMFSFLVIGFPNTILLNFFEAR